MSTVLLEDCYLRLRVKLECIDSETEIASAVDDNATTFEFFPDGLAATLDDESIVWQISEYTGTQVSSIAFFQKKACSAHGLCYYLGVLLPPDATEEQLRECRDTSSGYAWSLFLLLKEFGEFKCTDVTMWFDSLEGEALTTSFEVISQAHVCGHIFDTFEASSEAETPTPTPDESRTSSDLKHLDTDAPSPEDGANVKLDVFPTPTPRGTAVLITDTLATADSDPPSVEEVDAFAFKIPPLEHSVFYRHPRLHSMFVVLLRFLGACTAVLVLLYGLQATVGFGLGASSIEAAAGESEYYGGLLCILAFPVLLIETSYYFRFSLWIATKFAWPTFFAHEAYESLYWKAVLYATFSIPAYIVQGTWLAGLLLNTTALIGVLAKFLGEEDRKINHEKNRIDSLDAWFSRWEDDKKPGDRLINSEKTGVLRRNTPRTDITVQSAEAEALLTELHLREDCRHLGNVHARAEHLDQLVNDPDGKSMELVVELFLLADSQERLLLVEALQFNVDEQDRYPWPKGSPEPKDSNLVKLFRKMSELRPSGSKVTPKEWTMLDMHHNFASDKIKTSDDMLLEKTKWFGPGIDYQRNNQQDWFAVMVFKNEYIYDWDTRKQKKVRYVHDHGEACCQCKNLFMCGCGGSEEEQKTKARNDFDSIKSSREEIKRILIDLQLDVQECIPANGKEVYLLIRAPPKVLEMAAELLNVDMKLKGSKELDKAASKRERAILQKIHLWEPFEYHRRHDFQACRPSLKTPTPNYSQDPFADYMSDLELTSGSSLKILKLLIHQQTSKPKAGEHKGFFRLETCSGHCTAHPESSNSPDTSLHCWRCDFIAQFDDSRKERAKVGLYEFPLAQDPLNGVKVPGVSKILLSDMLFAKQTSFDEWEVRHGSAFEKLLDKEMTEIIQYTKSLQALLASADPAKNTKRKMLSRLSILTQKLKALKTRFGNQDPGTSLSRMRSLGPLENPAPFWSDLTSETPWCDLRMVVCQEMAVKLEISKPDFYEFGFLDSEDPTLQTAIKAAQDAWGTVRDESGLVGYLFNEAALHTCAHEDESVDDSHVYVHVNVMAVRGEAFSLQKNTSDDDGSLNDQLNAALDKGHLIKWFPLHEQDKLLYFQNEWANFYHILSSLWHWQPLADVYNYFGEEIGFYFEFLQMYTYYLAIPSLGGIFFVVQQLQTGSADLDLYGPAWCAGLLVWCAVFQAKWSMKELVGQETHNMTNFDKTRQGRQDQRTPRLTWKNDRWTWCRFLISLFIYIILLFLNLGLVLGLLVGRWQLTKHTDFGWVGSIIQGIVIVLVNLLLKEVAILLTEFENHMTNATFEKHLIIKSFILEATNSYTYFFVVAFVKSRSDYFGIASLIGYCTCEEWSASDCDWNNSACTCLKHDCMRELGNTLLSIFLANLVVGNLIEFGMPLLCGRLRQTFDNFTAPTIDGADDDTLRQSVVQGAEHNTGEFSLEALKQLQKTDEHENCKVLPDYIYTQRHQAPYLSHYDGYFGTFEDMNEMAIQFGFISMFSLAFPGICLLAFVNNVVEIRSDANKLCTILQRPWPQGSPGLGVWNSIINALMLMAILTNVSLLLFTSHFGERMATQTRVVVFIFAEHALFLMWYSLWRYFTEEIPIFSFIQYRQDKLHDKRRLELHKNEEEERWISHSRHTVERLVDFDDDGKGGSPDPSSRQSRLQTSGPQL